MKYILISLLMLLTTMANAQNVTFGPASPVTPSNVTLPSNTGTVNFAYRSAYATQCNGSITGSAGGALIPPNPLCTGTACNMPSTISATFFNNTNLAAGYSVNVTCTNDVSKNVTSSATVNVPAKSTVAAGCTNPPLVPGISPRKWAMLPAYTKILATYGAFGSQYVDTTKLDNLFTSPSRAHTAWPYEYNASPTVSLPTSSYISAAFMPLAPYFQHAPPAGLYGKIAVGESSFTGTISMTISTSCGDFGQMVPSTIVPGCYMNAGFADSFFVWRSGAGACSLHDNNLYYLNIINADISKLSTGGVATSTADPRVCTSGTCTDPLQNGPGNWSSYVP